MKRLILQTNDNNLKREAKSLGLTLLEELGDLPKIQIKNKEDEIKAIELAKGKGQVLLEFPEQKIIPLENLIAALLGKAKILVKVANAKEAKLAMETLELGSDGVVLKTDNIGEIKLAMDSVLSERRIKLEEGKVTTVRELRLGARACIDTCDIIEQGAGLLVGSSSQGMILVQAEVEQAKFVAPRPFRVNAGAISLYTITPSGKTKYLEEIKAGDEVLIVNRNGETKSCNVARSKIELRPLVLVEVENNEGKTAKAVLQNAETIKLVALSGSRPVTELKVGDKVMARFETGGRHFGTLVKEETVIEK